MSGDPVLTGSNPYYEDLQPRQRQCRIGDTISTVRVVAGLGRHLQCSIVTQAACDYANVLIAAGRWRVSRCGRCSRDASACTCKEITYA